LHVQIIQTLAKPLKSYGTALFQHKAEEGRKRERKVIVDGRINRNKKIKA
jgi:hypothetical protein